MSPKRHFKNLALLEPHYRFLVIIFSLLALLLIGLILYYSLSQATVYLTPNFKTQAVGFAIQVADQNKITATTDLKERLSGVILETAMEETKTFPVESYQTTESKASGQVTIINNYSKSQPLIATTRLLTSDGKLYRLTKTVLVEAGSKLITQAQADQEGAEFEIGPTKLTIPGLWEGLQDKIYAETEGFKKQNLTQYQITAAAIEKAKTDLKNSLTQKAKEELNKQLTGGQIIPENALVVETLKYSTDAQENSDQKEFAITLSLGVKAVVFDENRLKKIALASLPEIYKTNNAIVEMVPESFNYEITLLDQNSENLIAQVKGEYTIKVANLRLNPSELAKMSKKEAVEYLESFSDIKKADIILPFWTNKLPAIADKIDIQIKK